MKFKAVSVLLIGRSSWKDFCDLLMKIWAKIHERFSRIKNVLLVQTKGDQSVRRCTTDDVDDWCDSVMHSISSEMGWMMYGNLNGECFLNLAAVESEGMVRTRLNPLLQGVIPPYPFNRIETALGSIDVRRNKEYHIKNQFVDPPGRSYYWRYFLDIEPTETITEPEYIQHLREFIHEMRKRGLEVISACAFEEEISR